VAAAATAIYVGMGNEAVAEGTGGGDEVERGDEVTFGAAVDAAVEDAGTAALVEDGADEVVVEGGYEVKFGAVVEDGGVTVEEGGEGAETV
jgi:hypothetical protein